MKPFLDVFKSTQNSRPPLWMMRQAGRYLPEYRAIRQKAKSFLDFCYTPEFAVEATLQPIRRFGFDAAIIFSDILVIPDALGQGVLFVEGEGPRLDAINDRAGVLNLSADLDKIKLEPIYEALRQVKALLPRTVSLVGFCGAPWTLATYMIAGRGTPDQAPARQFAYRDPDAFLLLIDKLVASCIAHSCAQIEAGAECIQIFDSWAGILPEAEFQLWCVTPIASIVSGIKAVYPDTPVIGFPRAISGGFAQYVEATGIDALGLDTASRLPEVRSLLPEKTVTQGNLDPLVLIAGGEALDRAVSAILDSTHGSRHIFNLGHGILPPTPIEHVERLVKLVRQ